MFYFAAVLPATIRPYHNLQSQSSSKANPNSLIRAPFSLLFCSDLCFYITLYSVPFPTLLFCLSRGISSPFAQFLCVSLCVCYRGRLYQYKYTGKRTAGWGQPQWRHSSSCIMALSTPLPDRQWWQTLNEWPLLRLVQIIWDELLLLSVSSFITGDCCWILVSVSEFVFYRYIAISNSWHTFTLYP